jgi:hypothetical protein
MMDQYVRSSLPLPRNRFSISVSNASSSAAIAVNYPNPVSTAFIAKRSPS